MRLDAAGRRRGDNGQVRTGGPGPRGRRSRVPQIEIPSKGRQDQGAGLVEPPMQRLSQQAPGSCEPHTAPGQVKSCHLNFSFPNYIGTARLLRNFTRCDIPDPNSDSDRRNSYREIFAPSGAGRHPFDEVSL